MTDLDQLLADLPVAPVPLDELLAAGRRRRRQRRLTGVGAAAALALVAGGIAVLGSQGQLDWRSIAPAGGAGDVRTVRVVDADSTGYAELSSQLGTDTGPFWEAETESVYYVSDLAYSSSCPPSPSAVDDDGVLTLDLGRDADQLTCTADASRVVVVVEHVPDRPDELVVTDAGPTRTLPVPEGHTVVLHTEPLGTTGFSRDRAVVQTTLSASGPSTWTTLAPAGSTITWRGVPDGAWTLTGATLLCSGSCDDPAGRSDPTDTCRSGLTVDDRSYEVVVTVERGSPCEIVGF
jgi:hypothetical protein